MQKKYKILSLLILAIFIGGCSWPWLPRDFSFQYKWSGKVVPAPEHQEYLIKVDQNGQGKVLYYADYLIESVPENKLWQRQFTVGKDQMKNIYQLLKDKQVLEEKNIKEQVVSSRYQSEFAELWVKANKTSYFEKFVSGTEPGLKNLETTLKNLVPGNIWQEMEQQKQLDISNNSDVLDYQLPEID